MFAHIPLLERFSEKEIKQVISFSLEIKHNIIMYSKSISLMAGLAVPISKCTVEILPPSKLKLHKDEHSFQSVGLGKSSYILLVSLRRDFV